MLGPRSARRTKSRGSVIAKFSSPHPSLRSGPFGPATPVIVPSPYHHTTVPPPSDHRHPTCDPSPSHHHPHRPSAIPPPSRRHPTLPTDRRHPSTVPSPSHLHPSAIPAGHPRNAITSVLAYLHVPTRGHTDNRLVNRIPPVCGPIKTRDHNNNHHRRVEASARRLASVARRKHFESESRIVRERFAGTTVVNQ